MLEVTAKAGDGFVTLRDGKKSIDIFSEDVARVVAEILQATFASNLGADFPINMDIIEKPN